MRSGSLPFSFLPKPSLNPHGLLVLFGVNILLLAHAHVGRLALRRCLECFRQRTSAVFLGLAVFASPASTIVADNGEVVHDADSTVGAVFHLNVAHDGVGQTFPRGIVQGGRHADAARVGNRGGHAVDAGVGDGVIEAQLGVGALFGFFHQQGSVGLDVGVLQEFLKRWTALFPWSGWARHATRARHEASVSNGGTVSSFL